ncbi:MAG: glutathione S-transferase N-terminal domain-containing protein [Labilithrix sp.]|nr:glutathione S-transferase N-terminal domain-containing protein [Labilithrix sp.]
MDVYFSPLACSVSVRIALYEAGLEARFIEVDRITKRIAGGGDYREVNPLGLVPLLRMDDGTSLTEASAILQYVAVLAKARGEESLAPNDDLGRARLQAWLSFVATELHKAVFAPQFLPDAPQAAKDCAMSLAPPRFEHIARELEGRDYLLGERFSVADAYLVAVLGWTVLFPALALEKWPSLAAYAARARERPAVKRALSEELPLYQASRASR